MKATKRILRYLKHTQNVSLRYPKGAKFELVGYSDSDYAGCKVERRSTSDTCQLLGRSLLGILNITTKSRQFLILVTVPKMPNLSLIPLKPSCHPQHDMRAVLKYAIALLDK